MHLLVNFASECDKCLKEFEQNIVVSGRNPHAFNNSESGACRLVRTAAKALTSHGSEKAGVASYWNSFLEDKGESNKIVTFRSNRFNILFFDAAALFFHKSHLQDFLNQFLSPNDLLKSVEFDISEKVYLAEIRALGIIDKILTGPMWRLFEQEGGILSLNPYLKIAIEKLQTWGHDASSIFEGDQLFMDIPIHKDEIYESLFADADPELDSLTQMCLELLSHSIMLILDRQAKDQLPNGKYADPSSVLAEQAKSVPKTNTVSERDFGSLDLLLRMKPAASTLCYESVILWTNNKTSEWLNSLEPEEKDQVLDHARKRAPEIKQKFQERKDKIKKQKLEKLKEKQNKRELKETKQRVMKVELVNEISKLGGVWSVDEIDAKIENLKQTGSGAILNALYCQLKFHKEVLHSKGPKELFQKTVKKRNFTESELIENLKQIVNMNNDNANEVKPRSLVIKEINEIKQDVNTIKQNVAAKILAQREKRVIDQQVNLLPKFTSDPKLLLGKKIKHKCFDDHNVAQWYTATVNKIDKLHVEPLKVRYEVHYDETEINELYSMNLLMDLKKGDLIVLE